MNNKYMRLVILLNMLTVGTEMSYAENPPPKYPICVPAQSVPPDGTTATNGSCNSEGLFCVETVGVGCAQAAGFQKPKDATCDGDKKSEEPCNTESKQLTQGKSQQGCSDFGQPFLGNCKCEHTGTEDNNSDNGGWRSVTYKVCK
jgi:hypothetical protein